MNASPLPRPLLPFMDFAASLRANDFSLAPEQTESFVAGVGLLGPRSISDVHRAAIATLAPPPERRDEFDALFRLVFLGQTVAAPAAAKADDDDEIQAFDDRDGGNEPPESAEPEQSGSAPTGAERLFARHFGEATENEILRRFQRAAPVALPQRRSRRLISSKARGQLDMRRALREAVRRDGEVVRLPVLQRRPVQRRVLLLIDVSGSMKDRTDAQLRFAHALARATSRLEVFTLGTRLTRITRAMKRSSRDQALAMASTLVADWDGGTRLGDALQAFLAVPRFAGFARGAFCIVLSDGLERGDPSAMTDAVARMSQLAWAIAWLTPLAGDDGYAVETSALKAALPYLDRLGNASSPERLCGEILRFQRKAG
ncbi:MAG: VWA domain-containing protein [Pseudorhodoplanes sp.]|uniref:vWA domain-containing protein n=1 Tax=Pseudorhodoplanes sp. TaxID=1934341 RepID=UPI003D09F6FD